MKNENKYGKQKDVKKCKGEIKQKPDWMSKLPSKYQLNIPNMWSGRTWYYCHRDTVGKCNGQYFKQNPSECQVTMKRKSIHLNKRKSRDRGKRNPIS